MRKIVFIIAASLVFIPGILQLYRGYFFGDDPYQYALAAKVMFLHFHSVYSYPYPVMGIIYFPTIFLSSNELVWFATLLSMLFFFTMFISFYLILRSLNLTEYQSILGSLVFSFSIPFLSEIGWGGQAQFLSLTFSFLAIYFFFKDKKYFSWALVLISLLTEPYSAVFSLIVIFSFLIYKRSFRDMIPFFISGILALLILFYIKSSSGIIIQPLLFHLSFTIFGIYYLYFLILLIFIIILIFLFNHKKIFFRTETGKKYLPIIIIFSIPIIVYIFITPYTVPDRLSYFIMIPIAIAVSVFLLYQKDKTKKLIVVALALVLVAVSYYSYFGDINFYSEPIYLEQVGSYIKSNSLNNETFLNVNIPSGWALETFASREMFYGASNLSDMIYMNQINNVLLGKIMSNSQYYINSTHTYLFLQNSTNPFSMYTFNEVSFSKILELNLTNSFLGVVPLINYHLNLNNGKINIGDFSMYIKGDYNLSVNLNSSVPVKLIFDIENGTVMYLSSSTLELESNNNVNLKISLSDIKSEIVKPSELIMQFIGNASFTISDGLKFSFHLTDKLFSEFGTKFAVVFNGSSAERFYSDSNFKLVKTIGNVLIFLFKE